jgi:hypothetical protein
MADQNNPEIKIAPYVPLRGLDHFEGRLFTFTTRNFHCVPRKGERVEIDVTGLEISNFVSDLLDEHGVDVVDTEVMEVTWAYGDWADCDVIVDCEVTEAPDWVRAYKQIRERRIERDDDSHLWQIRAHEK